MFQSNYKQARFRHGLTDVFVLIGRKMLFLYLLIGGSSMRLAACLGLAVIAIDLAHKKKFKELAKERCTATASNGEQRGPLGDPRCFSAETLPTTKRSSSAVPLEPFCEVSRQSPEEAVGTWHAPRTEATARSPADGQKLWDAAEQCTFPHAA